MPSTHLSAPPTGTGSLSGSSISPAGSRKLRRISSEEMAMMDDADSNYYSLHGETPIQDLDDPRPYRFQVNALSGLMHFSGSAFSPLFSISAEILSGSELPVALG